MFQLPCLRFCAQIFIEIKGEFFEIETPRKVS